MGAEYMDVISVIVIITVASAILLPIFGWVIAHPQKKLS